MGKVNLYVKTCLINEINEYNIKGILLNNIIKYHDNDAKMIINMKNNTLERIKKEEKYLFDFNNNICIVNSKDLNLSFPIKVLDISNNNIFYVKYYIGNSLYEYKIKVLEEI